MPSEIQGQLETKMEKKMETKMQTKMKTKMERMTKRSRDRKLGESTDYFSAPAMMEAKHYAKQFFFYELSFTALHERENSLPHARMLNMNYEFWFLQLVFGFLRPPLLLHFRFRF